MAEADSTSEKTHELLEKLSNYVMKELPTRREVDDKIDKLAEYVMEKIPSIEQKLEEKADKKDVQRLLDGQDKIIGELDPIRTEQAAFNPARGGQACFRQG